MPSPQMRETDLYEPVKRFLAGQGYDVKGEVGKVDIVGCRGDEAPVLIELKTNFSLSLIHQAIDRLAVSDVVYIAVPHRPGRLFSRSLKRNLTLCRRLGIGLMTVRPEDASVFVHLDPGPYRPRASVRKKQQLLREFEKRVGDPNRGGATRRGLITAYRQDALRCLSFLSKSGPSKAALVASEASVENARRIMSDDHYGWFQRVARGIYAITPKGEEAMMQYERELARLAA